MIAQLFLNRQLII